MFQSIISLRKEYINGGYDDFMKKAGIVCGCGPASTVEYYNGLLELHHKKYGISSCPRIVLDSVNMKDIDDNLYSGNFKGAQDIVVESVKNLEKAGADFGAIACNTLHYGWADMSKKFGIPVISILDASVEYIKEKGYKNVLILASGTTLKNGLYADTLEAAGITHVVPNADDIEIIANIVYPNLENGIVVPEEKETMIKLCEKYIANDNCDAVLLGCTEIPIMIKEGDLSVDIIDTTKIHIKKISEYIYKEE
ncbi:MAG: amino acid racemase [Lachnospiraceae bacterium]|nr:amino acid racemase [Lachnospiraceae bacterium]